MSIQMAIRAKDPMMNFEGSDIVVSDRFSVRTRSCRTCSFVLFSCLCFSFISFFCGAIIVDPIRVIIEVKGGFESFLWTSHWHHIHISLCVVGVHYHEPCILTLSTDIILTLYGHYIDFIWTFSGLLSDFLLPSYCIVFASYPHHHHIIFTSYLHYIYIIFTSSSHHVHIIFTSSSHHTAIGVHYDESWVCRPVSPTWQSAGSLPTSGHDGSRLRLDR